METFLFDRIVFGPIKSRRLGNSLGINLLPVNSKFCNFDCIYCECGWTWGRSNKNASQKLPEPFTVSEELINIIRELQKKGEVIDNITFAGNGEPTLHPKFDKVMDDVKLIRDLMLPDAKISVLTNGTMLHNKRIKESLKKADNTIFKLDAGSEELFQFINRPLGKVTLENIKGELAKLKGDLIIQTLFLQGEYAGESIDNTTREELEKWIGHIREINPQVVMVYSIDRNTPADHLKPISKKKLNTIAKKLEPYGIQAMVA